MPRHASSDIVQYEPFLYSPSNILTYHSELRIPNSAFASAPFRTPNSEFRICDSTIPHCDSLRSHAWLPPANRSSLRLNSWGVRSSELRIPNSELRTPNSAFALALFRIRISVSVSALFSALRQRSRRTRAYLGRRYSILPRSLYHRGQNQEPRMRYLKQGMLLQHPRFPFY